MKRKSLTRVLALDLHPRRFGYVVVEGVDRLLDWGVCSYRGRGNPRDTLIRRRLRPLLELWRPSLLVVHGSRQMSPRQNLFRVKLLKAVTAEAKTYRVCVRMPKKPSAGEPPEKLTKYERAQAVARGFAILVQKLPSKRKLWESEHYSMSIFESLAIAVRHLA